MTHTTDPEPAVRITVFGRLTVVFGPRTVTPNPAAATLLGYLAVHGQLPRDRVAFALWPDRPDDRARRALSDAIYRLRGLGDDGHPLVSTDGDLLGIAQGVVIDLDEFDRGIDDADPAIRLQAAAAVTDEPLAGIDAEWADVARQTITRRLIDGLARTWADFAAAGRHAQALTAAEHWAATDPFDEAGQRAAMRSAAELGQVGRALRRYDDVSALLAAELAVDPAPDTVELARQLRADSQAAATARPVMVGRTDERARLLDLLTRAAGGAGGMAVVVGDPGLGKSLLLDELADAAAWRRIDVGRSSGSAEHPASLIAGMIDLIPASRLDQLADLTDPAWIGVFRALLPDPTPDAVTTVPQPEEIAVMVPELLTALGRLGPQLLLIDDVHWATAHTWDLLDVLLPHLGGLPIAVVVAARGDELRHDPHRWQRVEAWDRVGVTVVGLGPLDESSIVELLTASGSTPSDAETLARRAGGNPLVARTLGLSPLGEAAGVATADDDVWRQRIDRLDPAERALAELAAVLGRTFAYRHVRGDDPAAGAVAIAGLQRTGLIVDAPDGYRFTHDVWRTALLAGLGPTTIVDLHATATDRLIADPMADPIDVLAHADAAGRTEPIAEFARRAGDAALARGDAAAAADLFDRALDADELSDVERFDLLEALATATEVLADPDRHDRAIADLEGAGEQLGGRAYAEAMRQAAVRALHAARFDEALERAHAGQAVVDGLIDASSDPVAERGLRLLSARFDAVTASASRELGQVEVASAHCTLALDAFAAAGSDAGVATMTDLAGGLAWRRGDSAEAARLHQRAATAFGELGMPRHRARALNNLGTAQWARGDYGDAAVSHTAALELCRSLGDRRGEGDTIDNLGGVAWALGDDDTAIERYSAALAIRRATDDPWGVSISLSNLGDVHRAIGDSTEALALYDESIRVNADAGVVRNDATTRMARGWALLDAGDLDAAEAELSAAADLLDDLGDRPNLADATAGLLTAATRRGDTARAGELAGELAALIRPDDRADLRLTVALAEAERSPDAATAAAARSAHDDVLAGFDPLRARVIAGQRVLHRRTTELCRRFSDIAAVTTAAGAEVEVTVRAPGDPDGRSGRLAAIRRIVAEVASAGSTIGDNDLAVVLGVTRRTILRDVAALRDDGFSVATTGRS